MKILLDAGHGKGENRGSLIGNEGDNTYHYSLVLKAELERYGAIVGLTRPKLEDNPSLARRGAMGKGYDIMISLHSNAFSDPKVNGIELWDSVQKPNKELATKLINELAKEFRTNRGVKYKELNKGLDWYGILRDNQAKYGMLIEHGFHTNLEDAKVFTEKRQALAERTTKVLAEHYGLKPVEKPVEKPVGKPVVKGLKVGDKVKYNGYLYKTSLGAGRGSKVNGTFTIDKINKNSYGVHLKGYGWVKPNDVVKATAKPKKEKWLRIPTTITTYAYYLPNQTNKTVANRAGTLRPINYRHQAKYIEYKVLAEKGNFKTIQLHGNPKNPAIDIFTGKGTEHAWEIFYK